MHQTIDTTGPCLAVSGSYRRAEMRKKLSADYEKMSAMTFATPPEFETVMASIYELEQVLNTVDIATSV